MSVRKSPGVPSEIPLSEIKARLTEVAHILEIGGRVTMTIHGRPVADLVQHDPSASLATKPVRKMPTRVTPKDGPSLEEILNELRGDR